MAKEVVVTREGYNKLEQELENLRTVNKVYRKVGLLQLDK